MITVKSGDYVVSCNSDCISVGSSGGEIESQYSWTTDAKQHSAATAAKTRRCICVYDTLLTCYWTASDCCQSGAADAFHLGGISCSSYLPWHDNSNISIISWNCLDVVQKLQTWQLWTFGVWILKDSWICLRGRFQGERIRGWQWQRQRWLDAVQSDCSIKNVSLVEKFERHKL